MEPSKKDELLDEWKKWKEDADDSLKVVKGWKDQMPEYDPPETTPEFEKGFDNAVRLKEIDSEIARVESMQAKDIDQDEKIRRRLAELNNERREIEGTQLPPTHAVPAGDDQDHPFTGNVELRTESGMSDATLRKYMALSEPKIEFTYVGKSPSLLQSQLDRVKATKRRIKSARKK